MEQKSAERHVLAELPRGPATDNAGERPGVPMETGPEPHGRPSPPTRQRGAERHLTRAGLERPTPVVGTAQPPHGLSGALRRRAYEIPEHYARHWSLLLMADRVDVLEDRVGSALATPLERAGLHTGAARVRANPLPVLAGVLMGGWLASRALL